MLQKIHERVQGVIAWTLIILIAITFTLWGVNYYLESHNALDSQAEVNGFKITRVDFNSAYQRLKHQEESRLGGEITSKEEKVLKEQALKQLISTYVVVQGAHEAGYLVTQHQAEQALLQIPQFQEGGQFSAEKFQQAMSSSLYTPSVFLKRIQDGLLVNQQRFSFAGTAFILKNELKRFIQLFNQTRSFRYLIIPVSLFQKTEKATQQEARDYYEKNKIQFKTPEKTSIEYLLLSLKEVAAKIHVSEKELKQYYQDNIDTYTHPAEWQWTHILVRVPKDASPAQIEKAYQRAKEIEKRIKEEGKSFVSEVKASSDDVLSAANDGIMPWTPETSLSPVMKKTLLGLSGQGAVSSPVQTEYGYEIIQLVGYRKSFIMSFDSVKNQIAEMLKADRAQQQFSDMSDDLTDLTYQNPNSLDEASKALDLPIQKTDLFSRAGLKKGIASQKKIVQAAFSDEVLLGENNSQPISLNDDTLVVLRVNKHIPQSFIPFDKVQPLVENRVSAQKAAVRVRELGEKFLKALENNEPLNTNELSQYKLAWIDEKDIRREDNSANAEIQQIVFKMSHPDKGKKSLRGIRLDSGDYALIELEAVKMGRSSDLNDEELKNFQGQVEAAFGIIDYDLYVYGLLQKAKIVRH